MLLLLRKTMRVDSKHADSNSVATTLLFSRDILELVQCRPWGLSDLRSFVLLARPPPWTRECEDLFGSIRFPLTKD
jgi:hypothetical protein